MSNMASQGKIIHENERTKKWWQDSYAHITLDVQIPKRAINTYYAQLLGEINMWNYI